MEGATNPNSSTAIGNELFNLIKELQILSSLSSLVLAGGTSLALRFNHRESDDIDLFVDRIVGVMGLENIQSELQIFYKEDLYHCEIINKELGDQFCFLRGFIRKGEIVIKIEITQNMPFTDPVEEYQGIKVLTIKDIGLLKLMSASNRMANKDIYDLDYITDVIPLSQLLYELKAKLARFSGPEYKCLFDLDGQKSPSDDINLLLAFDNIDYKELPNRPNHSSDILKIIDGHKKWVNAKVSWRRKVKQLMREMNIPIPPARPIN